MSFTSRRESGVNKLRSLSEKCFDRWDLLKNRECNSKKTYSTFALWRVQIYFPIVCKHDA